MSFTYNPPPGLTVTPNGSCFDLSWSVPSLIVPPLLLLHFDGTNGQTTTVDSSGAGHVITMNPSFTQLSTSSPKFGSASLSVALANMFNSYAVATPFALGSALDIFATNAWTIDCWMRVTSSSSGGTFAYNYGGSISTPDSSDFSLFVFDHGNGTVDLGWTDSGTFGSGQSIVQTFTGQSIFGWHHYALALNAGVVTAYFDGVALTTTKTNWNASSYTNVNASPHVVVGSFTRLNNNTDSCNIDEFAVWNYAKYTSNFVPPVLPYGTPPGYDIYRDGVSVFSYVNPPVPNLLLHFDGTNGQTSAVDSSVNNFPMTFSGDATLTTVSPAFGTASLNCPDTTTTAGHQLVTTPVVAGGPLDILSGAADFTIEGFFWINAGFSTQQLCILDYGNDQSGGGFNANAAGLVLFAGALNFNISTGVTGSSPWGGISNAVSISTGAWHHFAIVRMSGTGTLYLDGNAQAGAPVWSGFTLSGSYHGFVNIGGSQTFNGAVCPGKVDEIRVVKGQALYTANFTPPAAPFTLPVTSYHDCPPFGIHAYTVAAWDGTMDISAQSAPVPGSSTVSVYGKFLPAPVFVPSTFPSSGLIEPRVWMPKENTTVKT